MGSSSYLPKVRPLVSGGAGVSPSQPRSRVRATGTAFVDFIVNVGDREGLR